MELLTLIVQLAQLAVSLLALIADWFNLSGRADTKGEMPELAEARRLLTSREAAERLGVSPDTIRHLAKTSVLPPVRFGERGLYRFRADDVDRLLSPRETA